MTEEQKTTEEKECKCFCKSKEFKGFITIALGTFVGFYCALSLFAALHRPPMMPPHAFGPHGGMRGCPVKMIHHHFNKAPRPDRQDFRFEGYGQQTPAPFQAERNIQK